MPRLPASDAQRDQMRQTLRRAAAKVYRKHGLNGVTARAVAIEAGVSVGTLYAHFGDLKSLLQSLWIEPVQRFNAQFRDVAAAHGHPIKRLRALMQAYSGIAAEHPELYRNAFLFVRAEPLAPDDKDAADAAVFLDLVQTAVRDGQAAGLIRSGSDRRLAELLWAGLHGAIALPVNFDRVPISDPQDMAADMIDFLLVRLRSR